MNTQIIGKAFGIESFAVQRWINQIKPQAQRVELALATLDKRVGGRMISNHIAPLPYLFKHEELTKVVWDLSSAYIKSLDEDVYQSHLAQLLLADKAGTDKSFPYDNFQAEAFIVYRNETLKSVLTFTKNMFYRSISHHTFRAARKTLKELAEKHEINLITLQMNSALKVLENESQADKTAAAQRVLQLMDASEDGDERYCEFVDLVAKEAKIPRNQLEAELEPFI
jgi:hypothetical protein